jgi:DNA-binding MarR family transcriptional regulator
MCINANAWISEFHAFASKSIVSPELAEMTKPSKSAISAWIALNRAQRRIFEMVEADLKSAGLPPLVWYDVLLELWRQPGRRLRQSDLERRMLFPQYQISRLVDRLEGEKLVRRERCADDARAHWVAISDDGLALRQRMWPLYAAAIQRHVGEKLSDREASLIAEGLSKLLPR